MGTAFNLGVLAALEVFYALITRAWLPFHYSGIGLELLITTGRALMAALAWQWFGSLIQSGFRPLAAHQRPAACAAAIALLAGATLCGRYSLQGTSLKVTWAATSLVVGLHEELVFRGILQNLLLEPLGFFGTVVLSNVVFTVFHFGAQPLDPANAFSIFVTGCVLGVLYQRTGSIMAAIAIHATLDAWICFSPFLQLPWPDIDRIYFDLIALLFAVSLHPSRQAGWKSKMP